MKKYKEECVELVWKKAQLVEYEVEEEQRTEDKIFIFERYIWQFGVSIMQEDGFPVREKPGMRKYTEEALLLMKGAREIACELSERHPEDAELIRLCDAWKQETPRYDGLADILEAAHKKACADIKENHAEWEAYWKKMNECAERDSAKVSQEEIYLLSELSYLIWLMIRNED